MNENNRIPSPASLTTAPLRHRLKVELKAPTSDVWSLVGSHARLPEYSAGIASVDVETRGNERVRTCRFHSPDASAPGMVIRERIRWEVDGLGYATTAEPGNDFGLKNDLSLVTLVPSASGTTFTWEQYYDAEDVPAMRASFDEGLADMATRLVARFGGREIERWVDRT
jgi:hypothetical protein